MKKNPLKNNGLALKLSDISHQVEKLEIMDHPIQLAPVKMVAFDNAGKIILATKRTAELEIFYSAADPEDEIWKTGSHSQ